MTRRVVVTGVGLISSVGIGTEANWEALLRRPERHRADHALRRVGVLGADRRRGQGVRSAAVHREEGRQEDGRLHPVRRGGVGVRRRGRAARRSRRRSPTTSACSSPRASAGSARSSASTTSCINGGPRRISPFFIPASIINLAAGQVSIRFGARGPNLATCTACTASAHAIGEAFEIIRRGDADVMIAGGSEASITPMGVGGFAAMRALSTRNDEPGARQPAVRQGPRRLRHRRRRRHPRSSRSSSSRKRARRARSTPRSSATACRATRTT